MKNNPKRIVVFLGVKNLSLIFEDIQKIFSITYLEKCSGRSLIDLNPTQENALEQEAVDLLKARLKTLKSQQDERNEA